MFSVFTINPPGLDYTWYLQLNFISLHIPGPQFPDFIKLQSESFPCCRLLYFPGQALLRCSSHVDEVGVAGAEVATYRFPEVIWDVCAGAMDDEWMEEDRVALLHV